NVLTNRNLALACQRFDAVLLSISSDYVFDGENAPAGGYREWDEPHPLSRYGETKRWGEQVVESLLNKFFIVRTSWLFGPGRPTWVDLVLSAGRDDRPIAAARDMVSSPTFTADLAPALLELVESRCYGIYHLSNSGSCSREELAREVLGIHRLQRYTGLRALTLAELRLPAPRPRYSVLDNAAWRAEGRKPLRDWKSALAEYFVSRPAAI
ncbi:MAG TPA: NAD(P)-dependent oxidoreductase, partial [Elusimicrobiota bacterium]|nr:NAD(P)-dependent oxidoreductase [Elusimicrobiota bacterium]